jgi:hypothetical protein
VFRRSDALASAGCPIDDVGGLTNMTASGADRDLHRYLETLAGDAPESAFLEIRFRVGDHAMASEFVAVHGHGEQVRAIRRRGSRTDVYVGCAPRARRAGTKNAIDEVWVLWAECDGADAARAAHAYRPRPPIVIASGTGPNLHAYWPLRAPLRAREAEEANLRLAHALGADVACFDASRILRPPGTWNHKRRPSRPVGVVRLEAGTTFDHEAVLRTAPAIDRVELHRRWRVVAKRDARCDPLLRLPPSVYVQALIGRRPSRQGKVACPFHPDTRPSLHVYREPERGWTCFACGRGGSVYDLAAGIWGLRTRGRDFVEVRTRLLALFARELAATRELTR